MTTDLNNKMLLTKEEIKQIEFLKNKKPVERFKSMVELIDGQIEIMKSGILFHNPKLSKEEVETCLKKRLEKMYSLNR